MKLDNLPEPKNAVALNQESVGQFPTNRFQSVRKIRITCNDPYATDSSDDEGVVGEKKLKRFVREITFPSSDASKRENALSTNSAKNSKKKAISSPKEGRARRGAGKYRGVRQRKWGKWAAEIRDPIQHKRVWLGTYNSAEEASKVYEMKHMEFQTLISKIKPCNEPDNKKSAAGAAAKKRASDTPEDNTEIVVSHGFTATPKSVLELDLTTSPAGGNAKVATDAVVVTDIAKTTVVEPSGVGPGLVDDEMTALVRGLDFDLDLDNLMMDGLDFNPPLNDLAWGFEDFPIGGEEGYENCPLPDYDFDLDLKEIELWMDDNDVQAQTGNYGSSSRVAQP